MSRPSSGGSPPLLLLFEPRAPAAQAAHPPPPWRNAAAFVLEQVRERGGLVAHLFSAPLEEAGRWRVVPELRPDPAEPVFYGGAGASANPALAAFTARAGRGTTILAGASVESAVLATALGLVTAGRAVSLAADALGAAPSEWRGLEALAAMPDFPAGGALRIEPAAVLLPVRPQFRLIAGGRA